MTSYVPTYVNRSSDLCNDLIDIYRRFNEFRKCIAGNYSTHLRFPISNNLANPRAWQASKPCRSFVQNTNDLHGDRLLDHGRDMDVRERGEVLPHVDHLDGHRFLVESPREQPIARVAGRGLLLDGHRGLEGHLSKVLSDHTDHVRPGILLGSAVGGDATRVEGPS